MIGDQPDDQLQHSAPDEPAEQQQQELLANAIHFSDKIRKTISEFPSKVRNEPPLPHGFFEGALSGLAVYGITRPVRSLGVKMAGPSYGTYTGVVIGVGQILISAQMALYAAVMVGSHAWLSTLTDFAAAPKASANLTNVHKTLLADDLCQHALVQKYLANENITSNSNNNNNNNSPGMATSPSISFIDWIQRPETIVTDEFLRAVQNCQNRKEITTSSRDQS